MALSEQTHPLALTRTRIGHEGAKRGRASCALVHPADGEAGEVAERDCPYTKYRQRVVAGVFQLTGLTRGSIQSQQ